MQLSFIDDAQPLRKPKRKKAHKRKKSTKPKVSARPARGKGLPVLPSGWQPPALTMRQDWHLRFMAHYLPTICLESWAAPIPTTGPNIIETLARLAELAP